MEAIIHWFTQIIVYLLLAAIIDLFIPPNNMKRYIKLIIGLILMLIFLKPLFYLFNLNINEDLETSLLRVYEGETSINSFENLISIQKIDIQTSQHAYILEQMTNQLKVIANDHLIERYEVEIDRIDFIFDHEQQLDYENLKEVIVMIKGHNDQKGTVPLIDEVIIFPEVKDEKNHELDLDNIKFLLEDLWQIKDKKLSVKWGGGTFER